MKEIVGLTIENHRVRKALGGMRENPSSASGSDAEQRQARNS